MNVEWTSYKNEIHHIINHLIKCNAKDKEEWSYLIAEIKDEKQTLPYYLFDSNPDLIDIKNDVILKKYTLISQIPLNHKHRIFYRYSTFESGNFKLALYIPKKHDSIYGTLCTGICFDRKTNEPKIITCYFVRNINGKSYASATIIEIAKNIYESNTYDELIKKGILTDDHDLTKNIKEIYKNNVQTKVERVNCYLKYLNDDIFSNMNASPFEPNTFDKNNEKTEYYSCKILDYAFSKNKSLFNDDFKNIKNEMDNNGIKDETYLKVCEIIYNYKQDN